jgi:site-specific DNA-adenine methylase
MSRSITALAPWYGSARIVGPHVGHLLSGCDWLGIPFAGGMSELAHVKARTVLVGDLHRHVINLAAVVADPVLNERLRERLAAAPFHPDVFSGSQEFCQLVERLQSEFSRDRVSLSRIPDLDWAYHYFITAWMSRSATAGTDREFQAGLSVRWEAGGGDSVTRFRNATAALAEWQAIMARCTFVCLDVFEFLGKVKDAEKHAVYLDPPWFKDGDCYRHKFTVDQHKEMARRLAGFSAARIVVRAGDHPFVRELYPEAGRWRWHEIEGRTMANKTKAEALIVRNGE